jgi:hypothetical protein
MVNAARGCGCPAGRNFSPSLPCTLPYEIGIGRNVRKKKGPRRGINKLMNKNQN